jgi:hypothetical protein
MDGDDSATHPHVTMNTITKHSSWTLTPTLGVDIGRVLIAGEGSSDTSFFGGTDAEAMETPEIEGAFDAVAHLVDRFDGRVWLVSKCGPRIQARTTLWLAHHDFFGRTKVDSQNVRFCRERPEKAVICARLGVTHFVDDRADVLRAMIDVVPHRFLFGGATPETRDWTAVPTWRDAEPAIEATLR